MTTTIYRDAYPHRWICPKFQACRSSRSRSLSRSLQTHWVHKDNSFSILIKHDPAWTNAHIQTGG